MQLIPVNDGNPSPFMILQRAMLPFDKPLETAVLFLVFNRPDTTAHVFEAIRQAKPTRLYIAADAAREGRPAEAVKVAKVRQISTNVDWSCEVKTLFRENNLGCKYSVSSAITWFFEHEDEGIILEDDCLPSQSFFWFCEEMLNRYRLDKSVMAITGTNITRNVNFDGDYFFSRYALMWGWGSWASAWKEYDLELDNWPKHDQLKHLKLLGVTGLNERMRWKDILTRTRDKLIDTWDYQWIYSCWVSGGLTIAPAKNLIQNIGFSDNATHTVGYHPILSNLHLNDLHWPLRDPLECKPHSDADLFIGKYWFEVSWKLEAKRFLLRLPAIATFNNLRKTYFEKIH
jgi:hypothetical protein